MPHVSGHGRPGFSSSKPSKPKKPKKPSSSVNQGPPSGSGSSGSSSYGQSGNQVDPGLQQALQNYKTGIYTR